MGSYCISNNNFLQFKDNLFNVKINSFNTDFSTLITNNNFNHLNIVNTYKYTYYEKLEQYDNYNRKNFVQVIYDSTNEILYLKYDNIYNSNTTIQVTINQVLVTPGTISQINKNNEHDLNSLYLVLTNIKSCPYQAIIILTVTFNNYIPTLYFDQSIDQSIINYPNIVSNYLYLYKTDSKLIIYNNINSSNTNSIYINPTFYNTNILNNICILNISYIDNDIFKPIKTFICTNIPSTTNIVDNGYHNYCISYITNTLESEVSEQETIICNQSIVRIDNIPISDNLNVIGRKIYRSYANKTKLFLLTTINDNTTTTFIDTISDSKLGFGYNFNTFIQYNTIPKISRKTTKVLIKLK